MRKTILPAIVLLLAGAALPCICPAAATIRINGSGSALDMMKPLVEAYTRANRDVQIQMEKPLGSSGAINALLGGALDVAVSSRRLRPEEIEKGARLKEYGKTPLALAAEKSLPKSDIATWELEDIYAGRTTYWKNGEKIRLVLRPRADIDTLILQSLSSDMKNAIDIALSRPGMITAVTDPEAYALIAKTPGGLGATGLTSIIVENLPLAILTLNGVKPTLRTLANGTYPLGKEISFVTTSKTPPAALKFISFIYSRQGRAIAENAGVLVTAKNAPDR